MTKHSRAATNGVKTKPRTTSDDARATTSPIPIPTAEKMRTLLGWVAHNIEYITEETVDAYEVNCLRSQVLQLLALANDVESLEVSLHHERHSSKAVAS